MPVSDMSPNSDQAQIHDQARVDNEWSRAVGADGLVKIFNDAGVLDAADIHVAQRLSSLVQEPDERVVLAVAFIVRAVRGGSVCVDLGTLEHQVDMPDLPWPPLQQWRAAVTASALVTTAGVLRCEHDLLYLDRYWREERHIAREILVLANFRHTTGQLHSERLFPSDNIEQRRAADIALSRGLTVLTGGPGTGKTTTVARLLALLAHDAELNQARRLRIALAAPTGKAAARLYEAVAHEVGQLDQDDRDRIGDLRATTLHRLLGSRADTSSRFRHHRENRLPHDVIVVDEASMVSLTMMARLLEAVRPQSRLLLVGDPHQLASVEAGAVLADVVDGLSSGVDAPIATLVTAHRFGTSISELGSAIREGDGDRVLKVLSAGGPNIEWLDPENSDIREECGNSENQRGPEYSVDQLRAVLLDKALAVREAASSGDGYEALKMLGQHRLLCAHRQGPYGVSYWNHQVQRWLAENTGAPLWSSWYVGRPVLVSANNYGLGLFNGDVGVTIVRDGVLRVVIAGSSGPIELATTRLTEVDTMHAMTIHKSQGSQAAEVTVVLPPADSRLLTRQLLYTAVTRARHKVRIVGSAEQVRAAVARQVVRATGLSQRLRASAETGSC